MKPQIQVLPSTQEILQAANSPEVQNVIAQEAQQAGESPQQVTDQVVNIVNTCMSNLQACKQVAGFLWGAVQTVLG